MKQPTIGYPEMAKSSLVLFDMAAFYLPLYGCTWKEFFPHYGVLGLVEGLIYQTEIALESETPRLIWSEQQAQIESFLRGQGLDSPPACRHLAEIGEYFGLVHQMMQGPVDQASIRRGMEVRPADIRLLHTLLAQMLGQTHDAELFDLLWPLEVLLDIKANLSEYAQDMQSGHYNTCLQLVRLAGPDASRLIQNEQQRYQALLQQRLTGARPSNQRRIAEMMRQHEEEYPSPTTFPDVAGSWEADQLKQE